MFDHQTPSLESVIFWNRSKLATDIFLQDKRHIFFPDRNRTLKLMGGSSRDYRNHHCELLQKNEKANVPIAQHLALCQGIFEHYVWRI